MNYQSAIEQFLCGGKSCFEEAEICNGLNLLGNALLAINYGSEQNEIG
jgi:hypothetical protein